MHWQQDLLLYFSVPWNCVGVKSHFTVSPKVFRKEGRRTIPHVGGAGWYPPPLSEIVPRNFCILQWNRKLYCTVKPRNFSTLKPETAAWNYCCILQLPWNFSVPWNCIFLYFTVPWSFIVFYLDTWNCILQFFLLQKFLQV